MAIDTAPFIYFIEKHPTYLPVLKPLFLTNDDRWPTDVGGLRILKFDDYLA